MAVTGSTLNTLASYAILGLIAGTVYFMQKPKRTAPPVQKGPAEAPPKDKGSNKKKERAEKARLEVKEKPQPEPPAVQHALPARETIDDKKDNEEFAKQLASRREGTKLESKTSKDTKKQKSVKQSRAEVRNFDEKPQAASGPSSTTGNEADDDQSPAPSPEVGPADAGDVADMLEPAPAGPTTLRLVDTDSAKPKPQLKKEKPKEPVLTKKQRQNKKKAESDKAERQAAEADRKSKEEAQRRRAREAEGRLPRDGSQYTNAAVNGANAAWKNGAPTAKAAQEPVATQPLDTFDKPAEAPVPAPVPAPAPVSSKLEKSWIDAIPSEEAQMEMLQEEEWNTVPSKSKKGRKAAPVEVDEEQVAAIAAAATAQAPIPARPLPQQKPHGGSKANGKPALTSGGSFAALSTDEPEEESIEWDV
jgi:hypothetical protein